MKLQWVDNQKRHQVLCCGVKKVKQVKKEDVEDVEGRIRWELEVEVGVVGLFDVNITPPR